MKFLPASGGLVRRFSGGFTRLWRVYPELVEGLFLWGSAFMATGS